MKISVIILHFGELAVTKACIESLYKKESGKFSLIIVNNTNTKLSKNDFSLHSDGVVIQSKFNMGFAKGVNVGIAYALSHKADAILLLNNDTQIIKAILPTLSHELFSNDAVGIVAPAIAFKKKKHTLYDIGGTIVMPFGKTFHTEVASLSHISKRLVPYASGCCLLIKADVLRQVGPLDERFFLYYEDVDYCLRVQKAGWYVVVVPFVFIEHALSASAGRLSSFALYHQLRSLLLFGEKYYPHFLQRLPNLLFSMYQTLLFFKASPFATLQALSAWRSAF